MDRRLAAIFLLFAGFMPLTARAAVYLPFKGNVDFAKKQLTLALKPKKETPFAVEISQTARDSYHVLVNVENWNTPVFEVSTVLECSLDIVRDKNQVFRSLAGKLVSKYTLINNKPVKEISGQFEVKDGKVLVNAFSTGSISSEGFVQFIHPHKIDATIRLSGINIQDFLSSFSGKDRDDARGWADGEISLSGNLQRMDIKGRITSYDGEMQGLEYNSMLLNFEGLYPLIIFSDSVVTQVDGLTFNLSGSMDLRNRNIDKQFEALAKEPLVSNDGRNLEWTLKRIQSGTRGGTTELKYLLRKGEDIRSSSEEGTDILGIERKVVF